MHETLNINRSFEEISEIAKKHPERAILQKIRIDYIDDSDRSSLDYLLTELDYENKKVIRSDRYSDDDIKERGFETVAMWVIEDKKRYDECGKTYDLMGVRATATIHIPSYVYVGGEKKTHFKIQEINSGAIWGIENDSPATYIYEIANDQIEELLWYLQVLNVFVSDDRT